jgi:hypothetical protein
MCGVSIHHTGSYRRELTLHKPLIQKEATATKLLRPLANALLCLPVGSIMSEMLVRIREPVNSLTAVRQSRLLSLQSPSPLCQPLRQKKACISERFVIVGITLCTELRELLCCFAVFPLRMVWQGHMHDTLDCYTERVSLTSCPPRRDSTRCPPQPLQSVLCSLLIVFADICFAHRSSDGRACVSRVRASLARE